ncbi:MAG: TIGR03086 family protein [Micrococcales bacterium]|nr:MAG: TIGR03086 family protein [Micrococcales bacterium]PIE27990.1 MAG: TIGR03086 family protein [Micrococcales bacterium]
MTTTPELFRQRADRFSAVVDAVPIQDWDAPSPCAGWSARDVLHHVISTEREFLAGHGANPGPEPDLADPVGAWHRHVDAVAQALGPDGFAETRYDSWFGPTTVGATMVDVYGWDLIIHAWDLARAGGLPLEFADEELDAAQAGLEGFGESVYSPGICARPVDVATDASRQDHLLARTGRDPQWSPDPQ